MAKKQQAEVMPDEHREVWTGPAGRHVETSDGFGIMAMPGDTVVTHPDGSMSVERPVEVVDAEERQADEHST